MADWVTVARTDDLGEGELLGASVEGVPVMVANVGYEYWALGDECTHAGCLLSEGWIEGDAIECPCHGSRFDLATGGVAGPPATEPVLAFEVRVEGDEIQVARSAS